MKRRSRIGIVMTNTAVLLLAAAHLTTAAAADKWTVVPDKDNGKLAIKLNGKQFATYSYRDAAIPRPYFANIVASSGARITRNHPPAADDPQDHDRIHPGTWLAFGDLSGADSWRLAAPVEHVRVVEEPKAGDGVLNFAVENRYLAADGQQEICREICRYTFITVPDGVLVIWDSTFQSDADPFVFGDQEELGLGVRLARTVAVKGKQGGRILNSNGQRNEREAWGTQADWCDYSGPVGDQYVGITIMPHPDNFRQAWCHSRDTGFMAMNPFGRNAFTGGRKSAITIQPGESFRLRYGVLYHWHDDESDFDPERAYESYVQLVGEDAADRRAGLVGVVFALPEFRRANGIFRIESLDQSWSEEEMGEGWSACWSGWLRAPTSGRATLKLESSLNATVTVAGRRLDAEKGFGSAAFRVRKGDLYPLSIAVSKSRRSKRDHFRVSWLTPGGAEQPIDGDSLLHAATRPADLRRLYPELIDPPGHPPDVTADGRNVVVHYESGRFCGWPANQGLWSWGNEIAVAFSYNHYQDKTEMNEHSIDKSRPGRTALARSKDGGLTWKLEFPETLRGSRGKRRPSPGGIDFAHPDFALQCKNDGWRVSYDRGRTWSGFYKLPDEGGRRTLSARTDYCVAGPLECWFFLSAREPLVEASLEDRAFCARTTDGGKNVEFVSWMTGEPLAVRSVMPATVRVGDGHFVSVMRRRIDGGEGEELVKRNWIDAHESRDNGRSWQFLSKVAETDTGKHNGNPPALVRLDDGRLCVAYGYRATPYGIRAKVSGDNGQSWGREIGLRTDGRTYDIGYPRMTVRPDGKLVTVYYFTTAERPEQHIAATIWSPPMDE